MKGSSMRTERDLTTALASREALAPDAARFESPPSAVTRRRRLRTVAAVAAATFAVAGVVMTPVLLNRPSAGGPAGDPTSEPTSEPAPVVRNTTDPHALGRPDHYFTLPEVITVGGYEIRAWRAQPGLQAARVTRVGNDRAALVLLVYSPHWHAGQPSIFVDAQDPAQLTPNADVNGAPAIAVDTVVGGARVVGVQWGYAPDSYALLANVGRDDTSVVPPSRETV